MRFADSPTVSVTIDIAASPEQVWAVCTDLTRFGEWSPENRGGRWLNGATGPSVGAQFEGIQEHAARGRWETVSCVTVFDAPRCFEWRLGEVDHPGAVWSFNLAASEEGTTLTETVRMGPGPSGITDVIAAFPDKEERIIQRRVSEYEVGMTAVTLGIKAAVEANR